MFLRKYRYQHLATKSDVPQSPMNYDRHGLGNLKKQSGKPFDRLPVQPFVVYGIVFGLFIMIATKAETQT